MRSKTSKHYKPDSIYVDSAGTRYTVTYNPAIGVYCMFNLQPDNDIIANSGVCFSRWINDLKYQGFLRKC